MRKVILSSVRFGSMVKFGESARAAAHKVHSTTGFGKPIILLTSGGKEIKKPYNAVCYLVETEDEVAYNRHAILVPQGA